MLNLQIHKAAIKVIADQYEDSPTGWAPKSWEEMASMCDANAYLEDIDFIWHKDGYLLSEIANEIIEEVDYILNYIHTRSILYKDAK